MEKAENSLLSTINTGFKSGEILTPRPIKPKIELIDLTSVKNTMNTGFGDKGTIYLDCKKPSLVIHLAKENYLSEFETPTEKQLARDNLDVYSKKEVKSLITKLSDNVTDIIQGIEYVDSISKAYADYKIPETLFTL